MPTMITNQPARTGSNQTSSSSIQSSSFMTPAMNARMPQAHLKQLALNQVPFHARPHLLHVLETLEQCDDIQGQAIRSLAADFIDCYKFEPEVMDCLFRYLSCRFMLNQQELRLASLSQRDDKALLKQSMSDLRQGSFQSAEFMQNLLRGPARLGPVVTSHPTQLNRPDSSDHLLSYPNRGFDNDTDAVSFAENLWQKAGRRTEKPTVLEEAQGAIPAIKNILASMRKNGKVLMQEARQSNTSIDNQLLEAGNWIGGDRDGNPTITPALLGDVMKEWSALAFEQYIHKVSDDKLDNRPNCLYTLFKDAGNLEHLQALKSRLEATQRHVADNEPDNQTQGRFHSPAEFAEHVNHLKNSLNWSALNPNKESMVLQKLDQLTLWAHTFGFHGVSTHIRQNSEVNLHTVGALVKAAKPNTDYAKLTEGDKVSLLSKILNDDPDIRIPLGVRSSTPEIQKEIEFLESYKGLRVRFGDAALPTIITANTETLSDMLEVCVMLKYAGLASSPALGMNVVPLIETVPDMQNAKELLEGLLGTPAYKAHLTQTGNVQRVMLGYSDSMRGNGIVSAAWEGHKLPGELQQAAEAANVKLHFFHGRGGTEARGSRDSYADEIAHLDGGSLTAGYTQTEQGEEVFKKFGNRALSDHNISELISSTMQTNTQGVDMRIHAHGSSMESISRHADQAYQNLYQDPALADFLQQTTPLPYVGLSNAGSRPASRIANLQGPAFLAKLRAIPYVAAWYQSASMAPAYFGLGSGLKQHIDSVPGLATAKISELKTMYREWPFFKNLVDRAETAMNKADMTIAQQYAQLNPGTLPVFDKVKEEFELSRAMVDLVKGQNTEMSSPKTSALRQFAHFAQARLMQYAKTAEPSQRQAVETCIAMSLPTLAAALNRFG